MIRKLLLAAMLAFFSTLALSAETVVMVPVVVYDKDSNAVELGRNPSDEIFTKVSGHWFQGLLSFKNLPAKKYGWVYTTFEANRVCEAEGARFILFGYMQKNEASWFAGIKLYDRNEKKTIREFYSGDDISHYGRLIDSISGNILEGLEDVTGLNRDEIRKEETRPFEIRVPASVFYWSPIDGDWGSRLLGIAGLDVGMDIYPPQPRFLAGQMPIDWSIRPSLSYSYAMGKTDGYPLNYHGISLAVPGCLHFHINRKNTFYLGLGGYYEMELLKMKPKYEGSKSEYQNVFGIESLMGYEFTATESLNLFAEVRFDFHVNNDTFIAAKPACGISFNCYRGVQ